MIRLLRDEDAEAYCELRHEALLDAPLAFAASPDGDFAGNAKAVREQLRRAPDWAILGAFRERAGERLIGSAGIYRDQHLKAAHKAHLWGFYVTPPERRTGVASELLRAAIRHAESLPGITWLHLSVSSAASVAQRLYESVGFRTWGTEPDALRHEGRIVSECHMALRLGKGAD